MPSLTNLLIVSVVAFAAPFVLGLFPRLRLPAVVLEIVAGIVIGPSVLGIVDADQAVAVIALMGLTFVLFLAGLEIDLRRLRGPVLRVTALGFALSFGVAVVVSLGLKAAGLVDTPLLVAIILCATSLGVLVPVLKDAGEIASTFGQLIIAAASIADFGAIILLTVFFSGEGGTGATLLLLGSLFALAVAVFAVVRGAERSMRIRADLLRLQDTTAQIRVRAALALFVGFAAIAQQLGLEAILGAFIAGAIISLVDADQVMTHPDFRRQLDGPHTAIAGIMQATSLPFIVAATAIGMELGLIDAAASAALIGAGLLSVLIFPLTGLLLLKRSAPTDASEAAGDGEPGLEPAAPLMVM